MPPCKRPASSRPSRRETLTTDPTAEAVTESPAPADAGVVVSEETKTESTLLTAGDEPAKEAASEASDGEGAETAESKNEVPEAYADFVMPEGVTLDKAQVEAFAPIAKELGLTQEQAQKLVDLQAAKVQADMAAADATIAQWAEEAKADPEIGGAKWDGTLKAAQAAYVSVATPKLREMLDTTGFGNHPEVIRMFAAIGSKLGLDKTPPAGTDPARGQRSLEERLYGPKQ